MEKEKFIYNVTPAPGVNLFDWYLGAIRDFSNELKKYEDVELIDEYNLMNYSDKSGQIIGLTDKLYSTYESVKLYCPDLSYAEFIKKQTWLKDLTPAEFPSRDIFVDNINQFLEKK